VNDPPLKCGFVVGVAVLPAVVTVAVAVVVQPIELKKKRRVPVTVKIPNKGL
jgi:hypothetical protein